MSQREGAETMTSSIAAHRFPLNPARAGNSHCIQCMSKALWIIAAVLVAIWLAGAVIGFLGDIIHVVLIAAIAFGVFAVAKRKVAGR